MARLTPEDLVLAVERRRGLHLGVRGALRLSPYEARQLVMLIAPGSTEGDVAQSEFRDFFDLKYGKRSCIHIQPRPLGELLELLGTSTERGAIMLVRVPLRVAFLPSSRAPQCASLL